MNVKYLNIHNGIPQNTFDSDMEIDIAKITIDGLSVKSFEPGRAWHTGEPFGNFLYTDMPLLVFKGKEAEKKFIFEINHGITVYELWKDDNGLYYINACGAEPWFAAQFFFDFATVEWNKYRKAAWYETFKKDNGS